MKALFLLSLFPIVLGLSVDEKLKQLERKFNYLEKENVVLRNDLQQMKTASANFRERRQGERAAFSAVLDHTVEHVQIGQKIVFNKVLLNNQRVYSSNTGAFRAPDDGLYMFTYFIAQGTTGQSWVQLMKNGQVLNAAVADSQSQFHDTQGGNVAIVQLQAGDEVWVEEFHQSNARVYGGAPFSTFSGVIL
ncbi:complement C1q subcomponent subunit A-like [Mya arenaria]|uniref:complement C1q subcomponent subunit A-like n=1 Tax=Mya arenaria TaxID=6604 RepID=UPI0022E54716|nr:complement C1q subcomponent subunit A-like [Mya arenaria]